MSGLRAILHGSFRASINPFSKTRSLPCINISRFSLHGLPRVSGICDSKDEAGLWSLQHMGERGERIWPLSSPKDQQYRTTSKRYLNSSLNISNIARNMLHFQSDLFPFSTRANFGSRTYSSKAGGNQDGLPNVAAAVTPSAASDKTSEAIGNDWAGMLNHARQSAVDAAASVGEKAKEVSSEIAPYVQQLYDSHPYLEKVIVPVGGTLSAAAVAWLVMPKLLKKLHNYSMQSPFALISKGLNIELVPYEKSVWSALEDPARYLTTFMAFSQIGVMIAPTMSQYLHQAWRGAFVLSFIWFLHRWKTNFFSRAMASQITVGIDQERLMALEKVSSVGLLVLGVMALAEACGVPVQSILTVGGVGGVATAFAARDVLGNLLTGLSLQFSKPFSVGDNIKAGQIEGQVVDMGLTTTSLINSEKFPVIVPNSLFSSQAIINKSRAHWRSSVAKIPLRIDDLEKIPLVSEEIQSMLRSNPRVFLEKDVPYCYLSRIENSFAELTLGCNLKSMRKDEFYATEQDILLQAAKIIKKHGAELGSTQYDLPMNT